MTLVKWAAQNDPEDWTATGSVFECKSPWDYIWPNLPYFGWKCLAPKNARSTRAGTTPTLLP